MVKRKSRLSRRVAKVREQRLLRREKPFLQKVREFREGVQKTLKAMETKKTFAYYQIPTIFLHPKVYGGLEQLKREIHEMFPDADAKITVSKKGRISSDIKISNITPNQAIEIAAYFIIRGGSIKMEQEPPLM